jgi:hypothetical protein
LHPVFNSLPSEVDLNEKNFAVNQWQKRSEEFDFTAEDRVPDMQLNEVLWYGLKGETVSLPMPVRAAFVKCEPQKDDE